MYESFLIFRKARYLIQASLVTLVCVLLFALQDSPEPPNGGTWYGYAMGTIGALLIVWLGWYGIRKRRYTSTLGSVEGWLSAHVYFGVALLVIATLHSAGELGWNVHSLAYVLMCIVIVSGIYGVVLYRSTPRRIAGNLSGRSRDGMLKQVADLDRRSQRLLTDTLPDVQAAVSSAIERTAGVGETGRGLFARDDSKVLLPADQAGTGSDSRLVSNRDQKAILTYLSQQLAVSRGGAETLALRDLVDLFTERRRLLAGLRKDHRMQSQLRAWLFVHVPLTFALLAALTVHIVTVFLYW
jgi:hypothetical protein